MKTEKRIPRTSFQGSGVTEVMVLAYPAINKDLSVPIGELREKYGDQGYRHGMKQRFGDFRAKDKEMPEKQKDQEAFEMASAYVVHLQAGGDWKMPKGDVDTSGVVIEAMNRINSKKYPVEMLQKALAAKPEQLSKWRANADVKAMIAKIKAERLAKVAKDSEEEIEIDLE
jgi:hypothetical protein